VTGPGCSTRANAADVPGRDRRKQRSAQTEIGANRDRRKQRTAQTENGPDRERSARAEDVFDAADRLFNVPRRVGQHDL
jgi:hypothetical protein